MDARIDTVRTTGTVLSWYGKFYNQKIEIPQKIEVNQLNLLKEGFLQEINYLSNEFKTYANLMILAVNKNDVYMQTQLCDFQSPKNKEGLAFIAKINSTIERIESMRKSFANYGRFNSNLEQVSISLRELKKSLEEEIEYKLINNIKPNNNFRTNYAKFVEIAKQIVNATKHVKDINAFLDAEIELITQTNNYKKAI